MTPWQMALEQFTRRDPVKVPSINPRVPMAYMEECQFCHKPFLRTNNGQKYHVECRGPAKTAKRKEAEKRARRK